MADQLSKLAAVVSTCTSCRLCHERTRTVFARGQADAPLMVVGEAPGKNEDRTGFPFVGQAGQLLDELLEAAGIPESQIYLCNVLKCRPPKNRFPEADEPDICRAYLLEQIRLVQPKAIILAGRHAAKYVLLYGTSHDPQPISGWVNKEYRRRDLFGDIRFSIVYHPSYLLRNEIEEDREATVESLIRIWEYTRAKLEGRTPPVTPYREIQPPPPVKRQGRTLFGPTRRGDVL